MIKDVQRGGAAAAVFYIDLDHFKDVNDTLGHPVGDELIRNVTARLSGMLRADDLVARLGGDEFAVIIPARHRYRDPAAHGRTDHRGASAHPIRSAATTSSSAPASALRSSTSAQTAARPTSCATPTWRSIAPRTKAATAPASTTRRWTPTCRSASCSNTTCGDAIAQDGLTLAYQPIVNASGDKIVGVEALCRWTHPERGDIEPAQFIPIAEHSGLIIELGEWVLRRACTDGKAWPGHHRGGERLAAAIPPA